MHYPISLKKGKNMNTPLISIIIPVYNSEKYLAATLSSVQNQTLQDFEVICVNDGSTDNSLNILENFTKKDNRFKIFTQENAGGSASRNKGLELSKGKYIAFLDNDDIYHPQYLEILYHNIIKSEADISCCSYLKFYGEDNYNFSNETIKSQIDFISTSPFADKFIHKKKIETLMWLKLYKRELFENIRFALSLPAINDILLNIEILLNSSKAVVTKQKLIAYRIIPTSQTMKPLSEKRIDEYKNLPIEINRLMNNFPKFKNTLQKLSTRYTYGSCVKEYLQKYKPEKEDTNYNLLINNLQFLIKNKYINLSKLNFRRRLITWAFMNKKFKLLNIIKE